MRKVGCDGCGRDLEPGEVKIVEFTEATLPGANSQPGLASDTVTRADLCPACCFLVHSYLGEAEQDPKLLQAVA